MEEPECKECQMPVALGQHQRDCPNASAEEPAVLNPHQCRARDPATKTRCMLRGAHKPPGHAFPLPGGGLKTW